MNKKLLIGGSIVLGIVFIIIGIVYFIKTAGNLPAFFPGYEAGATNIHLKHGIASVLLGIALFIFAWFQSGNKPSVPLNSADSAN